MSQEPKFKIPTEQITLPSKGLIYPKDNPLSSGVIEMKYMTAKEEDILTNQNYIRQGIVFDKVIESLIISKINIDDLVIGDKNAILIASRILGYGKDYEFEFNGDKKTVDLTTLEDKELLEEDMIEVGLNEFRFTLPHSKNDITFKILTQGDEKKIEKELEGLKKLFPQATPPELTTKLKFIITSINGDRESKTIREFVDSAFLAKDSLTLRDEIKRVQPDIILQYVEEGEVEGTPIPINLNFFWPRSAV